MSYIPNPNLLNILKKKFNKALMDGGKVLEEKAKSNAPVKTGKLRASIELQKAGDGEITVVSKAAYSEAVEYGGLGRAAKPFMRTALAKSKKEILGKFKEII